MRRDAAKGVVGKGGKGRTGRNGQANTGADGDRRLVWSLKKGDQEALGVLIRRHHSRLFLHVDGICRNSADTEEVLQDTYLTAWTRIGSFEGKANLFTWVYRIAENRALMKRRQEQRRRRVTVPLEASTCFQGKEDDSPHWFFHRASPEEALLARESGREISRASACLGAIYREVFELRDLHGFSLEETCALLDLTLSAAKSRLHRGRLSMQKNLSGYVQT